MSDGVATANRATELSFNTIIAGSSGRHRCRHASLAESQGRRTIVVTVAATPLQHRREPIRNPWHTLCKQRPPKPTSKCTSVRSGTYLHDSDLAASIKELFFDVLDQLHAADASDDNDPDEAA